MFLLALLLLIIVVAVFVVRSQLAARDHPIQTRTAHRPASTRDEFDRWVDAGLLTEEQADAITAFEADQPSALGPTAVAVTSPGTEPAIAPSSVRPRWRSPRVPVVAESLGYLGAALAGAGLLLTVSSFWSELSAAGRMGLTGATAVVLGLAGLAVHEGADPALTRLRAVLWLASTMAAATFAGVVADAAGAETATVVGATAATTTAAVSGAYWWWRERPVQEMVALAAIPVAVGAWVLSLSTPLTTGVVVWVVGAALFVVGLRLLTPLPWITESVGGVTLVVGSGMIASEIEGSGMLVLVATGAVLVAVAVVRGLAPTGTGQVIAGLIGALAVVQSAPPTIAWFANEAGVLTGLTVWLSGIGLLAVGWTACTRWPVVFEILGAVVIVAGAAVCGAQAPGFAALFGIANAVALLALGMRPGRVVLSAVGALGLLGNVPWAISWFFPGENRAPLLIMVSGALIIAAAVLMTRLSGRFKSEMGHPHPA
ncbi:MAG: DUF2157 domain-containing protein [Acidimicrobiales bacterium]|nr:DUF2157 domain-containing protein [Acidimicrobiales bacterium]